MTATRPILIAGPTASGKSALALGLAERCNGIVINADSLQVYRELRILTARPGPDEEARVPHALYGHVPASEPYSVARWLADARSVFSRAQAEGLRPIIVGGTGLYFKALLEGLSPIPPIPEDVRMHWRAKARSRGPLALHAELAARDPEMAARLEPADTQRITRALEVFDATHRSLADWQRQPGTPLLAEGKTVRLVVDVPRAELYARCDRRFDAMMAEGALDEVRALLAVGLDQRLPSMQALGVTALGAALRGECSRDEAIAQAKVETRHYVKRQMTWLKRYMNSWNIVKTNNNCKILDTIIQLIDD